MWTAINEPDIHNLGLNKGTIQKIENFRDLINGFSVKLYDRRSVQSCHAYCQVKRHYV